MSNSLVYESTLKEICSLYERTLDVGEDARRERIVFSFFEISRHIRALEKQGGGGYGTQLIGRLSEDLSRRYGGGFKARTVAYIRDFSRLYRRDALDTGLTWTHYKALMAVGNPVRRAELERLAIEQRLSTSRLERLVRQVNRLSEDAPDVAALGTGKGLARLLRPREGRYGVFKVVVDPVEDGASLDLGFDTRISVCGAGFVDGEMLMLKGMGDAGRMALLETARWTDVKTRVRGAFEQVVCAPGERYRYRGTVLHVVDGDTVTVRMDLGFGVMRRERLRLRGVDAPELDLPEGKKARDFVRRSLPVGTGVTVLTYGGDVYGRYVADLLFGPGEGRFLNRECIESGVATYLDTGR